MSARNFSDRMIGRLQTTERDRKRLQAVYASKPLPRYESQESRKWSVISSHSRVRDTLMICVAILLHQLTSLNLVVCFVLCLAIRLAEIIYRHVRPRPRHYD